MAVAAIHCEKTLIELAQDFDVHPNRIKQWRRQLLEGATGWFGQATKPEPDPVIDVKTLQAKIGELTLENDFCPTLSARRVCSRAQENVRFDGQTQRQPTGHRSGDQQGQRP